MTEPISNQSSDREQVPETSISNETSVSVSSEILPQQPIENLALPEMGNNAITTKIELQQQEVQRLINKFTNEELTLQDIDEVLSKTIFEDKEAKRILFLTCLLTHTEQEQRNVVLTGESSRGKTYNIKEILWFFGKTDESSDLSRIISINDATPRSLIHSPNAIIVDDRTLQPIDMSKAPKKGDPQEAWQEWYELRRHMANFLDLSKRIVVFYDIPNFLLMKNLRSLLSHDEPICTHLITDKIGNGTNRTKKVLIKGYFTALFASAYGEMDEQEASRSFLLSPTDSVEKIRKAIELQAKKKTDMDFQKWYNTEPARVGLKTRVQEIENSGISDIKFKTEDIKNLEDWFFEHMTTIAPKAQRDFPRLYSIAEAWALLNFKFREKTSNSKYVYANSTDIEIAKEIYEPILTCNEMGLTPEQYDVWKIIEPECKEDMGLRISEIHSIYYYVKKRHCSDKRLREMLKNFCTAGLLKEEKEGVIIKYYPITHKETKQSELSQPSPSLDKA